MLYLVNTYFTIPKRLMGNLSPWAWVRVSTPSNKCGALRLDYSSLFDTPTPHSGSYITISSDCQDCVFGNFSGKPYKGLEKIVFGPSMKPLNIFVSLFWIVLFCFVLFCSFIFRIFLVTLTATDFLPEASVHNSSYLRNIFHGYGLNYWTNSVHSCL